jgi:hypothetical protein
MRLGRQFGSGTTFTRDELFNFYNAFEPGLNSNTFAWRIHDLKTKKIISSVSRSQFSLAYKPIYSPTIDKKLKELYTRLQNAFPHARKTVWSTQWLTEFMLHIPGRYATIIEAEKGSLESIFYFLKDHKYKNVFLEPGKKEIDLYISGCDHPIILKSLVSLSPLQSQKKFTSPALEKILLDIFAERDVFNAFQGHELSIIFNNAYNRYQVNFSTLMAYARRRGKSKPLAEFLSQQTDVPYIHPT